MLSPERTLGQCRVVGQGAVTCVECIKPSRAIAAGSQHQACLAIAVVFVLLLRIYVVAAEFARTALWGSVAVTVAVHVPYWVQAGLPSFSVFFCVVASVPGFLHRKLLFFLARVNAVCG